MQSFGQGNPNIDLQTQHCAVGPLNSLLTMILGSYIFGNQPRMRGPMPKKVEESPI